MTVVVYRSTDAGAPTLNAVQGSFINVLKACLVDGYGSKSGSGWTVPYTGTNRAAFKQPSGSNGRYLYVDESTADTYPRMCGYETMTSLTARTNSFPGPFQNTTALPGRLSIYKSDQSLGNTSPRPWILICNGPFFHFWCNGPGTIPVVSGTSTAGMCFGDFPSLVPVDQYNTILIATSAIGASTSTALTQLVSGVSNNPLVGHYVVRNYTQTGPSYQVAKFSNAALLDGGYMGAGTMVPPNPADGKIYIAPVQICEQLSNRGVWRGTLPGIFAPCYNAIGFHNDGDIVTNVDGYPGKIFEAHYMYSGTVALLEISDTW